MKLKESETLELKKTTSELKEAIISIVSILNKHQKGELYFGIKNDGSIIGQSISEKTIRDISKSISDYIEPKIFPMVTVEKLGRKNCIFISFEGVEIPYFAYGRAYIRIGDENKKLIEVQVALFAGTDKLTFLDIKQLKGNLFSLLEQSESYIKEHMNWRAKLDSREREEIPEVPIRAITEAIVNSLCHRDYTNPKGNEIAIFKDRIEIYNPGQFPEEYSPEDFIKGEERSVLRNPLIANVLYLSKDIERWGSGIRRIYEVCNKENVKVEFNRLKSGFLVIFHRKSKVTKTIPKATPKATPKTTQKTTQKIIRIIKENPSITREKLAMELKITPDGVKYHLDHLKKEGILIRVGGRKIGHWEIII